MTAVRSVVERYYDAFNARDWDAWAALLDEHVEITIEGDTLVGPEAAYAYTAETIRHFPGMRYALERVVAESNDMIVMECRLVNPAGERSADAWKLDGPVCQIYQVSDERIVSIRGYYSPSAIDRTPVAEVPSRADATRIAEERAALQRVTTLVADGAPPDALFAAVTEEAGRLLRGDLAGMIRFESDGMIVAIATWAAAGEHMDVSGRWPLDGDRLATTIRNSGLPVREDSWADVGGPIADFIREELGVRSSVGSPIIVEREVWGALFIHSTQFTPLPDDTEVRLGHFTQLVATVMANVQAHADLRLLAEEQAALRRVAERVARGAPPEEVFATVTEELGKFLMVEGAKMLRYEPHQMATFVASWGPLQAGIPVGRRLSFTGHSVTAQIFETWQPARVEDYVNAKGRLAALLHREGVRSAVGAPIIVEGRLWGALLVGSVQPDPLPPDTEQRIAEFAELVGVAIANLEARGEVERLAEEQAALRRVAELVAHESSAERVFAAVAEEVGTLLGVSSSAVLRFDADDTLTVLAAWGEPDRGITSTISCPVIVNGRPWGAIAVNSLQPEPLPPGTEQRVEKFTELVATAIANVQARADLTASRARIVAAGDEARRRIERNLHDGVQQRLISLSLAVRGAQTMLPDTPENPDLRRQLSRVGQGLVGVLDDLRELSRGLHPAILSEAGLDPALRALARRSSVPIRLHLNVEGRLSEPIEVAAYYVVSEALANVAKHAQATSVDIRAQAGDHRLDLTIQDNGIGGADPNRGSGLVGLSDRINALGGTIVITSPSGRGTQVRVALPISDS